MKPLSVSPLLCWELTTIRIYLEASQALCWMPGTHPSLTQSCKILYSFKKKGGEGRIRQNLSCALAAKIWHKKVLFLPLYRYAVEKIINLGLFFFPNRSSLFLGWKLTWKSLFEPRWLLFLPSLLVLSHNFLVFLLCLNSISLAGLPSIWS